MSKVLIIIGLLLFAFACRTFHNRWLSKTGWLAVLAATYLSGYFLSGSHLWGAFSLSLWLLFPWVEIVSRVRKLRFPIHNEVKHRFPPSRDVFPDLEAITSEVEDSGFEKADDAGWKWEETDHFVRIFYHREKKLQATVSVAQQDGFVFSHASLTTRQKDGTTFVTTNYPFSFTMKLAPQQRLQRCDTAEVFEEMLAAHDAYLTKHHVVQDTIADQDPDHLHTALETDLSQQIHHNLSAGVIVRADEEHFRYSWRGCFYLWFQVVKDMIRV